jgi:hypothetical protein
MYTEIKKQWVNALNSGEYQQTREHLKTYYGYCCLGVLCDLYSKANENGLWKEENNLFHFETVEGEYEYSTLPVNVSKWAGLDSDNPIIEYGEEKMRISDLNDTGKSFKEIAAIIEEQL